MKCPRCEKEFVFEFLDVWQWLNKSNLDDKQLSFLIYNYGSPICEECIKDLRCSFYVSGINPILKKRKQNF